MKKIITTITPDDACRKEISRIAQEYKLSVDTLKAAEIETGLSSIALRNLMSDGHDVKLSTVFAVLEAAGYEMIIRRKER